MATRWRWGPAEQRPKRGLVLRFIEDAEHPQAVGPRKAHRRLDDPTMLTAHEDESETAILWDLASPCPWTGSGPPEAAPAFKSA